MKINKNNYEIYILDYIEGKLVGNLLEEFEKFLDNNPDIRAEAEGVNELSLRSEEVLGDKNELKTIADPNFYEIPEFDKLAVSQIEGDITQSGKDKLQQLLENDEELINDISIYNKVKLSADDSVESSIKDELKNIPKTSKKEQVHKLAVAKLDGELSKEENRELSSDIPLAFNVDVKLLSYKKLLLKPNMSVKYENKEQLKRKLRIEPRKFTYVPLSIAASLIGLFFLINFLATKPEPVYMNTMADIQIPGNVKRAAMVNVERDNEKKTTGDIHAIQTAESNQTKVENSRAANQTSQELEIQSIPELVSSAPKRKKTLLVSVLTEESIEYEKKNMTFDTNSSSSDKSQAWVIVEKGVDVWKAMTSGEIVMANSYSENGRIKKLNLRTDRLEISQTFHDH